MIQFTTLLAAAHKIVGADGATAMCEMGEQFETVPPLTLAEALYVERRISLGEYRAVENNGFDFDGRKFIYA